MTPAPVFEIEGFVTVLDEPELGAVRLRYARLYDEAGRNIPAAVRAAAAHATGAGRRHWIADTAAPRDDPSPRDAAWVATQEFRDILLAIPLDTFVLIPAPAEADGVDNVWIPAWRDKTEAGLGGRIAVHVLTEDNMRALLLGRRAGS